MNRLNKKIEDLMSAISFAEAGEFETAREMLKEERRILFAVKNGQIDKKTLIPVRGLGLALISCISYQTVLI